MINLFQNKFIQLSGKLKQEFEVHKIRYITEDFKTYFYSIDLLKNCLKNIEDVSNISFLCYEKENKIRE